MIMPKQTIRGSTISWSTRATKPAAPRVGSSVPGNAAAFCDITIVKQFDVVWHPASGTTTPARAEGGGSKRRLPLTPSLIPLEISTRLNPCDLGCHSQEPQLDRRNQSRVEIPGAGPPVQAGGLPRHWGGRGCADFGEGSHRCCACEEGARDSPERIPSRRYIQPEARLPSRGVIRRE